MKILRLDLLAFGPFTNQSLCFEQGDCGLHLVYGANEAGKSSALRALTQLLYDIPHRSQDNFVHPNQNMRIGASLLDRNGQVLRCIRRKGLRDTLRADDDIEVISPERFANVLGGIDEAAFRKRFGIDYDELRRGGKAIVEGEGDLGAILFAAGAGMADLRPLQDQLASEADKLFKPRGSSLRINQALAQLTAVRKEIREAQLPSSEWVEHNTALHSATARKAEIDQQLVEKGAQKNKWERIRSAIPLIAKCDVARQELHGVSDAPLLPADFSDHRRDVAAKLDATQTSDRETAATIDELKRALDELDLPEAILAHRTMITGLHADLGSHQKAAKDRPALVLEQSRAEEDARAILRDLGRPDDLENTEELRLTGRQRLRIQSLANECKALLAKHEDAQECLHRLRRDCQHRERELAGMDTPVDSGALQHCVRRVQEQGNLEARLAEAQAEVLRLQEQAAVDMQRLPHWSGPLADLEVLPVPVAETIEHHERLLADDASEITTIQQQLDERHEEVRAIDQELEKLRLEHDVPTEDDLASARRQREHHWQSVRRLWLGDDVSDVDAADLPGQSAAAGELAQAYEASVQAADQIADRLRREATAVAEKAQLTAKRQQLTDRLNQLQERLATVRSREQKNQQGWREAWLPTGIEPRSPREMRSWVAKHAELLVLAKDIRKQEGVAQQLSTLLESHRQALSVCLGQLGQSPLTGDETLAAMLDRGQEVLARIEAIRSERQLLQRELDTLRRQLPEAQTHAEQTGAAVDRWREQWAQAVERIGLSQDAEAAEANQVVQKLDELFARLKDAGGLRERIEGIDRDADGLSQKVKRLAQTIAPDVSELPVEQAVGDLYDRLGTALRLQSSQDNLTGQLQREQAKSEQARTEINRLRATLEAMCREAGCSSPEELPTAEQRSSRRQELQMQLQALEEQLHELAAGAALDDFIRDAGQCDPDQLLPTIARLADEIAQLEEEKSQTSETIGSERAVLDRMDGSARAAQAQEQAEHLAAQIRADAEQYVRLRLSAAVLRGAIDRYREKNQGPVLGRASSLFANLTSGSFGGLRADYNDKGEAELVAVRPGNKQIVTTKGLSDGTESQLYLALRLAILEAYLASQEPFPFIVDDILKDFDDERSLATLKVLAQVSERTQVILFTHHQHLVQLAEDNLDNAVVFTHSLDRGGSESRRKND